MIASGMAWLAKMNTKIKNVQKNTQCVLQSLHIKQGLFKIVAKALGTDRNSFSYRFRPHVSKLEKGEHFESYWSSDEISAGVIYIKP